MKEYLPHNIKNIAVIGHSGSGKTNLMEAIAYYTGKTKRLGKTEDGTSISDYTPEEIKRKSSLNLTILPFEFEKYKLNFLDAPGLFDFAGGMIESIYAADSVIIVVSGKSGVTTGVKKAYQLAKNQGKSILFYISKIDAEHADFYRVLEQLKAVFGASVCPVVAPYYEHSRVKALIDFIDQKAYSYIDFKRKEVPMPSLAHRMEGMIEAISEAVAETDETLFDKFFAGEKFTPEELISGVHEGTKKRDISPVICGSAQSGIGLELLLEAIIKLLPSAQEVNQTLLPENPNVLCGYIFKTTVDPFLGKLSYFRILSGKIKAETESVCRRTGEKVKFNKLYSVFGKTQTEVKEIMSGDIGAVTKTAFESGDFFGDISTLPLAPIDYPKPCYSKAILITEKSDESKISAAIARLLQEDPTLNFQINQETKQQILSGLGDQHLEASLSKLENKFGIHLQLEEVRIPYRETIRKKVKAEGKYKKQTGGHGQYGHVWISFEPSASDSFIFEEKVFGGAVPKNYFPAVEKGLKESIQHGVLAGYPMVGIKATLLDGSYHPVDSSEMAFKTAAALAYREGIAKASPTLLEPVETLKVWVPEEQTGDMIGELNKRRARVLGMNPDARLKEMVAIEAEIPMAETLDFALAVRQMTQGLGTFTLHFLRYEQVPEHLQKDIIQNSGISKSDKI